MMIKITRALCMLCMPIGLLYARDIQIPRLDGSMISGYLSDVKSDSFSIVVGLQGTSKESIYSWFKFLDSAAAFQGIAVCCIESRGIGQKDNNITEYHRFNALNMRLDDYRSLINYVYMSSIPGWNGQIWLLGESEGGLIASQLLVEFTDIAGAVLIGTGGGMSMEEELLLTMQNYLDFKQVSSEQKMEVLSHFTDKLDWIKENPSAEGLFLGQGINWWASLLNTPSIVDTLRSYNKPLTVIHGIDDMHVPVQSSDFLVEKLKNRGSPCTYLRLESTKHMIRDLALFKELFANINNPFSTPFSLNYPSNYQNVSMEEIFARGGKAKVNAKVDVDESGNVECEASGSVEYDCGQWHAKAEVSAHERRKADGTVERGGSVTVGGGTTFNFPANMSM